MQVFLDELLVARLQFRKRNAILQGNGCLVREGSDEMFVLARESSLPFVENLENADHFLLRIAERHAQNVVRLKAGHGIDGGIEKRRFIRIFDDHRFAGD